MPQLLLQCGPSARHRADVFLDRGEWRLIIVGTPATLAERLHFEPFLAIPNLLILEQGAALQGELLGLSVHVSGEESPDDVHDP